MMSSGNSTMASEPLPKEIVTALKEGKARGLPDGWTVIIDKRNRRKWTAPNGGRSCDSIPKALAISVEMGLLPPDTKIQSGKRKRSLSPKAVSRPKQRSKPKKAAAVTLNSETADASVHASTNDSQRPDKDEEVSEDEPMQAPPEPMDPETTLDGLRRTAMPTTVHWDPESPDGTKIGWKVRLVHANNSWVDGRVVRYDPHTHKHKIRLESGKTLWLWLRNEQHNLFLATRIVWAHVKGYAWWPALVMESNVDDGDEHKKDTYVRLEFFSTGEVSTLRNTPDCIRPFDPDNLDPVVAKHKKKRNQKAYQLACDEFIKIQATRNEAAVFYATKALGMANQRGGSAVIGKRVQVFRNDVNYPYGDVVTGVARQYSLLQKKWLVSFDISEKTKQKYDAAWINLNDKQAALKVLDKNKDTLTEPDLVPFLYGFHYLHPPAAAAAAAAAAEAPSRDAILADLLTERCRGCVEYWKKDDIQLLCTKCNGSFHLGCFDPPLSLETWQRMLKEGTPLVCARCTPCRGCFQKDVAFGSHLQPTPSTLSFPSGEPLHLCSMCKDAYEDERFCPNCAHSWDDKKYQKIRRQIEWSGNKGRHRKGGSKFDDVGVPTSFGSFSGDDVWPVGARADPSFYFPETSEWGYTEVDMLVCDNCNIWVHAGCSGIDEDEYQETSDGDHPIYSKEFLCRICCRQRSKDLIAALQKEDKTMIFAVAVTEKVAPNYHDVIKHPMDLQTMLEMAESEEYLNYAWVREHFELMVLNALIFNRYYTKVWNEAKRYYTDALKKVFTKMGKAAPPGKYQKEIEKNFEKAEEARKQEEERLQLDESVEKKDLVAGSMATDVTLPKLRDAPPDQESCLPFTEVKLRSLDAYYCSWMDCCFICGSSGAADTLLFCVDCGEAFHSFCANAPVHSMAASSVAGWRCPNCKVCEISGDVPQDETRMLFCEMCDRAFSLDLLDPPLRSAPSGLWICGQCVDCQSCNNTSEPDGASTRHWSRDPDKCYRCGGCSGLADVEEYTKEMNCAVCSKLLRRDDEDFVDCRDCVAKVHTSCDPRAEEYVRLQELASRAQKAQKSKDHEYQCSKCIKATTNTIGAFPSISMFAPPLTSAQTGPMSSSGVDAQSDEKPAAGDCSLSAKVESKEEAPTVVIAEPLCGWGGQVDSVDEMTKWSDPRECCLCHLCGDDDAGFPDEDDENGAASEHVVAPTGRLLPMADGLWVHAACALWSSETWEAPDDGLVHAVEKARSRGAQLKCFGCGRHGATVGCNKSNCLFNYHLPCAKACGAVFTSSQQVYCASHKSSATGSILPTESFEQMKALMIAPTAEDESSSPTDVDICSRVGALVIHSIGEIEQKCDGFHSENYITSPGYVASRIFWSTRHSRVRTVYILKVERGEDGHAVFTVLPGDYPAGKITGSNVSQVYNTLMDRVRKINAKNFSHGDLLSKLPMIRRTRRKTFGLNGAQFFGFGMDHVRKTLETRPGVEAVVAPLTDSSPKYKFCFVQPTIDSIMELIRKRAAVKAEQALENSSGCARTEGIKAVARSGGSGRITRALVRIAEEDMGDSSQSARTKKSEEEKAKADKHLNQVKYRRMKSVPIEQRLVARRSHIHGWGLFTKLDIDKDDPIVEYMGEVIRRPIADKRERAYEISGEGSCYMFRLDLQRIVDATMTGSMARFMNHCCDPNAYAKIITVDTDVGQDRKIVVFAKRNITSGEEITYDYKFPVEDGSLRCTCGASNCIGRLN